MKKNFTLIFLILFMVGCAKPEVVQIEQPNDKNLNCKDLGLAILESEQLKQRAMNSREGTGANITRTLLFWPSLVGSMLNADKAIEAAEDRIFYLQVISLRKNCGTQIKIKQTGLIYQLKELKQMLDAGIITEKEFDLGKEKLLSNRNKNSQILENK